jgi:predicted enzyme related to lactoylglutathione lyase
MGPRTSYAPGTFSWVDLTTTDTAGAKAFYGSIFGWDAEDVGGGVYTMFRLDGSVVAGLGEQQEEDRKAGVPPAWLNYVAVEDADAAVARTTELGGKALTGAFDVFDAGRMAVLADPQGAVFAVWQAGERIGAERVNDIGCLTNNELATTDVEAARSFYTDLFGWTTEAIDTGPDGPAMATVQNGGSLNGNISDATGGAPPHWRPYFTVESVPDTLEQVTELAGTTLAGPIPIPAGQFAIVMDPQGATFALFEGEVDP